MDLIGLTNKTPDGQVEQTLLLTDQFNILSAKKAYGDMIQLTYLGPQNRMLGTRSLPGSDLKAVADHLGLTMLDDDLAIKRALVTYIEEDIRDGHVNTTLGFNVLCGSKEDQEYTLFLMKRSKEEVARTLGFTLPQNTLSNF
jgi:hypothetical protein